MLTCALLVPAAALFFSLRQTKQYEASAEVYINKQNLASALTGIPDTTLVVDEARAAETQANLAAVPEVARRAIAIAKVEWSHPGRPARASRRSHAKGGSDILDFTVTDPDPALAQRLATRVRAGVHRVPGRARHTALVQRTQRGVARS